MSVGQWKKDGARSLVGYIKKPNFELTVVQYWNLFGGLAEK